MELPSFTRLTLEVDDDPERCFSPDPGRVIHMTEMDVQEFIPCPNRRCHSGGLNVAGMLSGALRDGKTRLEDLYRCDGFEKHGHQPRTPCRNCFKVKAAWE